MKERRGRSPLAIDSRGDPASLIRDRDARLRRWTRCGEQRLAGAYQLFASTFEGNGRKRLSRSASSAI